MDGAIQELHAELFPQCVSAGVNWWMPPEHFVGRYMTQWDEPATLQLRQAVKCGVEQVRQEAVQRQWPNLFERLDQHLLCLGHALAGEAPSPQAHASENELQDQLRLTGDPSENSSQRKSRAQLMEEAKRAVVVAIDLAYHGSLYAKLREYLSTLPSDHLPYFLWDFYAHSHGALRHKGDETEVSNQHQLNKVQPGDIVHCGGIIGHGLMCVSYPYLAWKDSQWKMLCDFCHCTGATNYQVFPLPADAFVDGMAIRWKGPLEVIQTLRGISAWWAKSIRFPPLSRLIRCLTGRCFGRAAQKRILRHVALYLAGRPSDASMFCSEMIVSCWQMALLIHQLDLEQYMPMRPSRCTPRNLTEIPWYVASHWEYASLV